MNILFVTGVYPPDLGGPATAVLQAVCTLREQGHVVTVITFGDERDDAITIPKNISRLRRYINLYRLLRSQIKDDEIIVATDVVSVGIPTRLALLGRMNAFFVRLGGEWIWERAVQSEGYRDTLKNFWRTTSFIKQLKMALYRFVLSRASQVFVTSKILQDVYENVLPSSVTKKITVVQNQALFLDAKARASQHAVAEGARRFAYIGRFTPVKNLEMLVRVFIRLADKGLSCTLDLIGTGEDEEHLKMMAKDCSNIRVLSAVHPKEIVYLWSKYDAAVLPSWSDVYPHTVVEALAAGKPCIMTSEHGLPKSLPGTIEVDPHDEMAWEEVLTKLVQNAQSFSDLVSNVQPIQTSGIPLFSEALIQHTSLVAQPSLRHVVMVGYERELLNKNSDAFHRLQQYTDSQLQVTSMVISACAKDDSVHTTELTAYAWRGNALRRMTYACIKAVRIFWHTRKETLITAQDPFAAGFVAYSISRILGAPLEVQEHGDFFSGEWKREAWHHRIQAWIGGWILRRAERVRVVSERVRERVIRRGVAPEKVYVLPVAQQLASLKTIARSDQSYHARTVVPCRFVPQKGLDVLLQAFAHVHTQVPQATLTLVGSGPQEAWIRQEVERFGLAEVVTIAPWMAREDVWRGADVFVMSSRYEGFGRTLTEAAAASVAIVATDVGCVGSVLRPDRDALVVPTGDASALAHAWVRVLKDASLRASLTSSAKARVESVVQDPDAAAHAQREAWGETRRKPLSEGYLLDRWVLGFLILAVIMRTMSVVLFHAQLLHREWGFYRLVEHWFQGYGYTYAQELGCSSAYRSPGYLFFLTALYSVFSPQNTWAQAIVQNIFVVGALWLTYVVGIRLVGKRGALMGALLMALYPYTFYHYTQYYHTFLQAFFLLLTLWSLFRFVETKSLWRSIFVGVSIACAAYVQGTILPMTPFFALWVLYMLWPDWKKAVQGVALMAITSALIIAPWTYRNWKVFHHFVPLTTDLGHALFKANNENIYEITKLGYPQEVIVDTPSSTNPFYKQYVLPDTLRQTLQDAGVLRASVLWTQWHPIEPVLPVTTCAQHGLVNEYEFNQYWTQKTVDFWHREGWRALRLPLQKAMTFWRPGVFPTVKMGAEWSFQDSPWKVWVATSGVWVSTALVILAGWLGLVVMLLRRQRYAWIVLLCAIIYTCLHAIVAGYTKYRIPLDHIFAAYAGWVAWRVIEHVRGRYTKR